MVDVEPDLVRKPYQVVFEVLRDHLVERRLQDGLVLLEGPIAALFGISRAPVQRALSLLAEEGLICRFDGRGYLVRQSRRKPAPIRRALADVGISLPGSAIQAIRTRGRWEQILEEVEARAAEAMTLGRYRLLETDIAAHFEVSRTVVRDVLGRLHEKGIVQKDERSRWIVGPLRADDLRQYLEVRALFEPAALQAVGCPPDLEVLGLLRQRVVAAQSRSDSVSAQDMAQIEEDLHISCLEGSPNNCFRHILLQHQLPFAVKQMMNRHLGMNKAADDLRDHLAILDALTANRVDDAAKLLADHLWQDTRRDLGRLKAMSVLTDIAAAPYMQRFPD